MPDRVISRIWTMALLTLVAGASCSRPVPPPEPEKSTVPAPVEEVRLTSREGNRPTAEASPPPSPSAAPTQASAVAVPPESSAPLEPAAPLLEDEQGQPLPQTEALPRTDSAFFRKSAKELFEAIVSDDPARAEAFFFPLVAYRQVKAIKDPERDHERRLLAHFARDVHGYHKRLGENPEAATFVELRVPMEKSKWMAPGKEGNRIGYHRVLRSSLVFRTGEGKERSFEVTSLISWRGEWYVVHLNGFE